MFGLRKHKHSEEHRYYLLPGMGRSNRKRHRDLLKWAIIVGLVTSAIFGSLLYFLSHPYFRYLFFRP
jgi:hypothetical protein